MRVWIFSDLLIDRQSSPPFPQIPDADVCICAGNVMEGGPGYAVEWLGENIMPHMPVLFVPGNRDFFHSSFREGLFAAEMTAQYYEDLYFLHGRSIVLGGFHFIGASLWTDHKANGRVAATSKSLSNGLEDYKKMHLSKRRGTVFTPASSRKHHREDLRFIAANMSLLPQVPKVVITHHAPSLTSVPSALRSHALVASWTSPLDDFILHYSPLIWVHGHVRAHCNYEIGATRVVCNTRATVDSINPHFLHDFVLDLKHCFAGASSSPD